MATANTQAVSEWTLPANVAAASPDASWLDTFQLETRRLVADVPEAAPPYADNGQPLGGFASRKEVNVSGALLTSRALNSLSLFSALESLDVSGTLIAREGLSALPALMQLRRLNPRGTGIYSSDIKHLGGLRQLEWLDLSGTNINEAAVPVLARLLALRYLAVAGTAIGHTADELHAVMPHCEIDL